MAEASRGSAERWLSLLESTRKLLPEPQQLEVDRLIVKARNERWFTEAEEKRAKALINEAFKNHPRVETWGAARRARLAQGLDP